MIGWKPAPFIFVHVPKCAGTSIEAAFLPAVTGCKHFKHLSQEERSKFWLPGNSGLQHKKLWQYEKHFPLKQYFKFAFVRNPWDRAISQIEYLRTTAKAGIFSSEIFKEQVQAYCLTKRNIWKHDLGACQADYLQDASGLITMDFIGKFETLTKDFKHICSVLEIEPAPELPHVFNSKRKSHYSRYYDDESAEWIRKRFAKDVDTFGYRFEQP